MNSTHDRQVRYEDILAARAAIGSVVKRTPLLHSQPASGLAGADVFLKLETLQETGSFKVRGAVNRLANLSAAEQQRGVVAVSTGNHARAVSWGAQRRGVAADIYLSSLVPGNKVQAIRDLGARVNIVGRSYDEAFAEAVRESSQSGRVLIPPFDDRDVVAGQGTIGLELLEDQPQLDTVIVPLSGGGLIAGIALAVKSLRPGARIIGVSMEIGPAMYHSLRAGHPVAVEEGVTIADSLAGGIGLDNRYTFQMVRDLVDEVVLVDEEQIRSGMRFLHAHHGLVTEGAAAVGIAALQAGKIGRLGERVGVIVSGQNVDAALFASIVKSESTAGSVGGEKP